MPYHFASECIVLVHSTKSISLAMHAWEIYNSNISLIIVHPSALQTLLYRNTCGKCDTCRNSLSYMVV